MTRKTQHAAAPPHAYQLKIILQEVRPPVWRRFVVRDDLSLFQIHELLQTIMGWSNSHLHQFVVRGERFNLPGLDLPPPRRDERLVRLRDVLAKPGDRLVYEYDFGDGWEHLLTLEAVSAHEPRIRYPIILAGKRACPPDDCGGPPGYEHLLEVLADTKHPEHDDLVEWVGGSFDPEAFDVGALNRAFHGGWYLAQEDSPRSKTALLKQVTRRPSAKARVR